MPVCPPRKCVPNDRRGRYEKPNAWHIFRRMNPGIHTLKEMSQHYQAFKAAKTNGDCGGHRTKK